VTGIGGFFKPGRRRSPIFFFFSFWQRSSAVRIPSYLPPSRPLFPGQARWVGKGRSSNFPVLQRLRLCLERFSFPSVLLYLGPGSRRGSFQDQRVLFPCGRFPCQRRNRLLVLSCQEVDGRISSPFLLVFFREDRLCYYHADDTPEPRFLEVLGVNPPARSSDDGIPLQFPI